MLWQQCHVQNGIAAAHFYVGFLRGGNDPLALVSARGANVIEMLLKVILKIGE